jgi:hypothetical protein
MVMLVIIMTDKQNHDMNDNFQRNLERELREVERRKYEKNLETLFNEWEDNGYKAGELAVKYFGSYLGAVITGLGLLLILHIHGMIQFTFWFDVAIMLFAVGAFIILASVYTSKIMPRKERRGNKND